MSCLLSYELEYNAWCYFEAGVVCEESLEHLRLLCREKRTVRKVAESAKDVDEGVCRNGGLAGLICVGVWVICEDFVQLVLDVCVRCLHRTVS